MRAQYLWPRALLLVLLAPACLHAGFPFLFVMLVCFFLLVVVVFAGAQGRQIFLHHVQGFSLYLCFFLVTTVAFAFCYLCADRTLLTCRGFSSFLSTCLFDFCLLTHAHSVILHLLTLRDPFAPRQSPHETVRTH